jgi:cbb3-type cytochrome oxidase subunit 1
MEKVGRNFLLLSAVYGVLGMGIGLYMASVETFKYSAVHSHLTLFGFVSLAIYGLAYRAGLAKNDRLATAHFWVSAVGAILFPIGEGIAISGGNIALAVVGSLLVILSGVQFVVAVYRA